LDVSVVTVLVARQNRSEPYCHQERIERICHPERIKGICHHLGSQAFVIRSEARHLSPERLKGICHPERSEGSGFLRAEIPGPALDLLTRHKPCQSAPSVSYGSKTRPEKGAQHLRCRSRYQRHDPLASSAPALPCH